MDERTAMTKRPHEQAKERARVGLGGKKSLVRGDRSWKKMGRGLTVDGQSGGLER